MNDKKIRTLKADYHDENLKECMGKPKTGKEKSVEAKTNASNPWNMTNKFTFDKFKKITIMTCTKRGEVNCENIFHRNCVELMIAYMI